MPFASTIIETLKEEKQANGLDCFLWPFDQLNGRCYRYQQTLRLFQYSCSLPHTRVHIYPEMLTEPLVGDTKSPFAHKLKMFVNYAFIGHLILPF